MPETKRLYYFTEAKYALQDIERRRLKIAELDKTNDPLELRLIAFHDEAEQSHFRSFFETMAKNFSIICFSETYKNAALWGHYADKNKGICLGFDINKDNIKRVKYVDNRKYIEEFPNLCKFLHRSDLESSNEECNREIKEILYTKSSTWRYEQEWRLFTKRAQVDQVTGKLYFFEFRDQLVLREILIGCRCPEPDIRSRLTKLTANYPILPKISFTCPSLSNFEISKVT